MAVVKVVCKKLKNNPHCPHGPTLKFVRTQNGSQHEFFACSTYRDRKDCAFYIAVGDKLSERIQEVWTLEKQNLLPYVDKTALEARLNEVKVVSPKDRLYCHTCSQLDILSRRELHRTHNSQTPITDHMLTHPSQILNPKTGSKKEAQYLFSGSTTKVIVDNLQRVGVTKVLCLGTPRVHEYIQAAEGHMQSLLLDLDHRYHSFWSSDKFVWYNMFNRHIFSPQHGKPMQPILRFLSGCGQVALVMDPPFGGHVEPLASTINYFMRLVAKKSHKELLVILIFPYFRERHIIKKCPCLVMLDYKVQYENHKEFNNGSKGRKLGSPVRLFTNMDKSKFVLPKDEGYRFCNLCLRWVSAENKHCSKCKTCPSKDGRTYSHCDRCSSCVKPHWQHCVKCQRCLPLNHHCASLVKYHQDEENIEPRHKRIKTVKYKTIPSNVKNKRRKIKRTEL